MIALMTILKANMILSVVKGMKFDMTKFIPRFPFGVLATLGLIFLFLVFVCAIISEEIIHPVVMYAIIANGKTPSYSFSDPI